MSQQPKVIPEILWCGNHRGMRHGNGWAFPRAVEKLLISLTEGKSVLHPFGGIASWGVRMDIDPLVKPDVIADAWMPPFAQDSFDVVILDPPYQAINSQEKIALFRAAAWIAREWVIWFHTIWISPCVGLKLERSWLVRVGDQQYIRCLQIFRVPERKQAPGRLFTRGPAIKYNRWIRQPEGLPFPPFVSTAEGAGMKAREKN